MIGVARIRFHMVFAVPSSTFFKMIGFYFFGYRFDYLGFFGTLGVATVVILTLLPVAMLTLGILLRKVACSPTDDVNKCLKQARNVTGVLEICDGRFWTISFGKLVTRDQLDF